MSSFIIRGLFSVPGAAELSGLLSRSRMIERPSEDCQGMLRLQIGYGPAVI